MEPSNAAEELDSANRKKIAATSITYKICARKGCTASRRNKMNCMNDASLAHPLSKKNHTAKISQC
eukprot:826625-Pleurochrysis_carterae.AAC.8